MPPLTALYFPQTAVSTRQMSQELVFFDKIFYYLTAETEEAGADETAELCTGYPPVPFRGDLDRFRELIRELKGNEAEFYSGQLAAITSQNAGNRDEQSVKSLMRSIEGEAGRDSAGKQTAAEEGLWQARLLLKLAEILEAEEQELQQELSALSRKEQELFELLKGEPEIPLDSAGFQPVDSRLPVRPEILVKAWAKLFLADDRRDKHAILVSGQSDAAELLFDANDALTGKRPVRLFRIPLPASNAMELDAFLQARAAFRDEARETVAGFASLLADTVAQGASPETLKNFSSLAAAWTRIFTGCSAWGRPAGTSAVSRGNCPAGEPHLEVYLCNASLPRLLGQVCKAAEQPAAAADSTLAVIALKSHRKSTCTG